MIWVINHISEYDETFPTFRYYREVVGRENINIFCAKDGETFDFLTADDVVLLRSGDRLMVNRLLARQREVGFKSTIETSDTIECAYNKETIKDVLTDNGIKTPKLYFFPEVIDGKAYFVKPMFGEDSKEISFQSVCHSRSEVEHITDILVGKAIIPMIEEYIDGVDCTVAVIKNSVTGEINTYAIDIEVDNKYGIQTQEVKSGTIAYCQPTATPSVNELAKKAFKAIGAKHYARVDFRISKEGVPYLIDLNIFPGFGIAGYMYRSLMLTQNKSYRDFIMEIIGSAD